MSLYCNCRVGISENVCLTPVVTGADLLQGADIGEDSIGILYSDSRSAGHCSSPGLLEHYKAPSIYEGPDLLESTPVYEHARDPLGLR